MEDLQQFRLMRRNGVRDHRHNSQLLSVRTMGLCKFLDCLSHPRLVPHKAFSSQIVGQGQNPSKLRVRLRMQVFDLNPKQSREELELRCPTFQASKFCF
jgi:hypothetical protein